MPLIKLGITAKGGEGVCKAAILRDLNRLEKWIDNKLTKPSENRPKDLHLEQTTTPCDDMDLGLVDLLGYSFVRRG